MILVDTIRTLHRLLATAKAEGAAEAYEAEAREWDAMRSAPGGMCWASEAIEKQKSFARNARERAAAIRKGIEAKEGK